MQEIALAGYSDRLSARPGDTIRFHVSSLADGMVEAALFRSICADPNPAGPGIVETPADAYFAPIRFAGRHQPFTPGSCAVTSQALKTPTSDDIGLDLYFWPTMPTGKDQHLAAWDGLELMITADGMPQLCWRGEPVIRGSEAVRRYRWYHAGLRLGSDGVLSLSIHQADRDAALVDEAARVELPAQLDDILILAACRRDGRFAGFFNGRLEAPSVSHADNIIASWDFAHDMQRLEVAATTGPALQLVNQPTRAVKGRHWDGSEFSWRHKPEHYAAIHFHDDDIYDFGWQEDFSITLPEDMPSGVFVMRISAGEHSDAMPFVVCPPRIDGTGNGPAAESRRNTKLCVLVSTFTYSIYGNHARPDFEDSWLDRIRDWGAYPHNPAQYPQYGLSTYNFHSDGSGICYASHKRPLFNLRPGYLTFGNTDCSGLRHFQADSHLIAWLHHHAIDYELISDDLLHEDGVEAIRGYDVVMTGSHPEYHTTESLNALRDYRDQGGALVYLGGNGFYWRIARQQDDPSLLEIRRSEDGLRAWAAEPGEYYHAFDGEYGGLWRRVGRPPQQLVGIGFTAQAGFVGMPYRRVCHDPAFDWVFEGIEDEVIGDFGFSGNGAAGFELDRTDSKLDSGQEITLLAQSFDTENNFILVPEEQLTHITNLSGQPEEAVKRADMVYCRDDKGGQVFAVGSITFCGSLPWNNFDNNVSRLLLNVIRHLTADG